MRGESGAMKERISMGSLGSCRYRINPESQNFGEESHVQLSQKRLYPCKKAEMYIIQENKIDGPFCKFPKMRELE